jgi:hypothetical protein
LTNFTLKKHWGCVDHDSRCSIDHSEFSDEYFWEFTKPEDVLATVINNCDLARFLSSGGGIEITDEPNPLPRFHKITVWAYHPNEKWLTWIKVAQK